ncbi:hypothetical protein [Streptomyces sp. TR02-1]|uniref:hypothetical protein n=1 Tax=Streptomyces sp. TR02-1 TaxID=3385977 RepID=UPI0039A05FA1
MRTGADYARSLREIADALENEDRSRTQPDWSAPHPDTARVLDSRRATKEQLNYSVPQALDLKRRLFALNADQGSPGAGTLVASLLDTALRSLGYPPDPARLHQEH